MHSFFLRFLGFKLNPSKPGRRRGEVIFARGKFKFKLFLNDSRYEPETLLLFLTFTKGYFFEKKKSKKISNFQGVTYFLTEGIGSLDM